MKADKHLEELGISFEEVVQDTPTKDCDAAARQRGVETSQIVKSLIIESDGEKYHILLPGDRTLSESKFGSEYRMIPPEKSKELTGFESGMVHPFSTKLKHFVDERLIEKDEVSHTVGEDKRGLIIESDKFRKALKESEFLFEIKDIVVSTEEDFKEIEAYGLEREDAKFVVNNNYRRIFKQLTQENDERDVINLLEAVNRNSCNIDFETGQEILERAKNDTHIQKLVSGLSEGEQLPEKEEEFSLEEEVSKLIDENAEAVEDFRSGKDSAINYLIGQLMEKTNGQVDAGKAREKILSEIK